MNGYGSGVRSHTITNGEIRDLHYREEGKLSYTCCKGCNVACIDEECFLIVVPSDKDKVVTTCCLNFKLVEAESY